MIAAITIKAATPPAIIKYFLLENKEPAAYVLVKLWLFHEFRYKVVIGLDHAPARRHKKHYGIPAFLVFLQVDKGIPE